MCVRKKEKDLENECERRTRKRWEREGGRQEEREGWLRIDR